MDPEILPQHRALGEPDGTVTWISQLTVVSWRTLSAPSLMHRSSREPLYTVSIFVLVRDKCSLLPGCVNNVLFAVAQQFYLIFGFASDQCQSRLIPYVNVHLFAPYHKTRHNKKTQIRRESRQSANSKITSGHKENERTNWNNKYFKHKLCCEINLYKIWVYKEWLIAFISWILLV